MKDNKELLRLARADQEDRQPERWIGNEAKIVKRDLARRQRLKELIDAGALKTGADFYNAALIYQHGAGTVDYKAATRLAKKAVLLGYPKAKWLWAASTDRYLLSIGRKQKYGTQYETVHRISKSGKILSSRFVLSPFDRRTSDATRAKYDVPALSKLRADERKFTALYLPKGGRS